MARHAAKAKSVVNSEMEGGADFTTPDEERAPFVVSTARSRPASTRLGDEVTFAITDVGMVGGVSTKEDGLFVVREGRIMSANGRFASVEV